MRKHVAKKRAARRARLTETKEKQKITQAQPLVAERLQQPRQEQEQAEQEGQPWHERLVPVDGRLQRQKLPSPERGQNDNDRGKTREFKQRDGKASYLPRRRRARRNLKDIAQIPWCANYVCSENSSNVFFLRTKRSWMLKIPWNLMQFWGNMTHSSCLYLCLGAKLNFRYKLLLHFPFPTRVQEQLALWPYSIHPESSKWHSKTTWDKTRILFIPHTEEKTLNKDNITYVRYKPPRK